MSTTTARPTSSQKQAAADTPLVPPAARVHRKVDVAELTRQTARLAVHEDTPCGDEEDDRSTIEVICSGSSLNYGEYSCCFPAYPHLDTNDKLDEANAGSHEKAFWLAACKAIEIAEAIDPRRLRRLRITTNNGNTVDTMNKYADGWAKKGWRNKKNVDLVKWIYYHPRRKNIEWIKS